MRKEFGKLDDGRQAHLYTLENENIIASFTDFGAALVSLTDKKTGIDIVQGFDDVRGFIDTRGTCFGATIGRTANRLAKGKFTLNGKEYTIPVNNNGNSLHGGIEGFDRKLFEGKEADGKVVFSYLSRDGEEGYPGNLAVTITYKLLDDGISITAQGTPDEDTLFAFTNHTYFNLEQSENVLDHELKIQADRYALSDENGMMKDESEPVEGTPFDFRDFMKFSEHINDDNEQLRLAKGYDHFFPVEGTGMRLMAQLRRGGLELDVESDLPGFHVYTGNYLPGCTGKYGVKYEEYSGVAIEASYWPNAINYENFDKPVVRKGETSVHEIRFLIKHI